MGVLWGSLFGDNLDDSGAWLSPLVALNPLILELEIAIRSALTSLATWGWMCHLAWMDDLFSKVTTSRGIGLSFLRHVSMVHALNDGFNSARIQAICIEAFTFCESQWVVVRWMHMLHYLLMLDDAEYPISRHD